MEVLTCMVSREKERYNIGNRRAKSSTKANFDLTKEYTWTNKAVFSNIARNELFETTSRFRQTYNIYIVG